MTVAPALVSSLRQLPRRDRYAAVALDAMPRILGLMDRNRLSPTYGSFDRSYWHYRTMDFPCGMSQEMGLTLALAATLDMPDNPYRGSSRLIELSLACVDHARLTSHADGSCDDYFPNERALGAVTFSLYTMAESVRILGDNRPETLEFLVRRARWLASHNESGRLSNHQAFAALALNTVHEVTGDQQFQRASQDYLTIVRDWFHPEEGWFWEYEGADPGYQSCTVAFLGKLYLKTGDESIRTELMEPAARFCAHFQHPDGSYAGEYGSRNTYHFYASGFEILAAHGHQPSAAVVDRYLDRSLPTAARYYNDDDRMCAHYVYDWMQAWQNFSNLRSEDLGIWEPAATQVFEQAGLATFTRRGYRVITALTKGGVTKITGPQGPLASDTGPLLRLGDGTVLTAHLVDRESVPQIDGLESPESDVSLTVQGHLCRRRSKLATPLKLVLFRLLNQTLGRVAPQLMRRTLQKILITGKPRTCWTFRRTVTITAGDVTIRTQISAPGGRPPGGTQRIREAWLASDATSIYVANSNTFQRSVLLDWVNLGELVEQVHQSGSGEHVRRFMLTDEESRCAKGQQS
jgi:hypothetical protein